MKLVALLVGSLLVGCSGSTAQISQADSLASGTDAATEDGATSSGDVGAHDAGPDTGEPSDAGEPAADANDAGVIDSGSPPIADASIDVIVAPDASPPPPVDAGPPACIQIDGKVACQFGGQTQGAYSNGIADDGCGSYYDCRATACGSNSNGPNDAGLPPNDPVKCTAGNVAGWKYTCKLGPDLMPSACTNMTDPEAWCCPIPKDGKPFSEVFF